MTLGRTDAKPLNKPMMTQFVDAYMRRQALMYFG